MQWNNHHHTKSFRQTIIILSTCRHHIQEISAAALLDAFLSFVDPIFWYLKDWKGRGIISITPIMHLSGRIRKGLLWQKVRKCGWSTTCKLWWIGNLLAWQN